MSSPWNQKLPQLLISHHAITVGDTGWSSHHVPAVFILRKKKRYLWPPWNWNLNSDFDSVAFRLYLLFSRNTWAPSLCECYSRNWWWVSTFSQHHLWAAPYYFPLPLIFCSAVCASLGCKLHYLSLPHAGGHTLVLFPQQHALWKCQVGLFTCPLLPRALLLWKTHTHTGSVWIVQCLLLISWLKASDTSSVSFI